MAFRKPESKPKKTVGIVKKSTVEKTIKPKKTIKKTVPLKNNIVDKKTVEKKIVEQKTIKNKKGVNIVNKKFITYGLSFILVFFLAWLMFYQVFPSVGNSINNFMVDSYNTIKNMSHSIKDYFYDTFKSWNFYEWLAKASSIIVPILIGFGMTTLCYYIPKIGKYLSLIFFVMIFVIGNFMIFTNKNVATNKKTNYVEDETVIQSDTTNFDNIYNKTTNFIKDKYNKLIGIKDVDFDDLKKSTRLIFDFLVSFLYVLLFCTVISFIPPIIRGIIKTYKYTFNK